MTLKSRASSTISSVELTLHFIERVERHDADIVGNGIHAPADANPMGFVLNPSERATPDQVQYDPELLEALNREWTGAPGSTAAMQPRDVIEIELENVGTRLNTIGEKGARP